ncbi:MAG: hypothetical protein C4563_06405 [Desulfobulbus sp.]|jgi:hypothetical protein|nr:MAG: hypothetical protein C4563_06405 [Desulfobulbus sp.]
MRFARVIAIALILCGTPIAAADALAWGPTTQLIAPTTGAATREIIIPEGLGSSLQLTGVLADGEAITLQRWNGSAWEQLKIDGADAKSLTSTNHIISMYGAMSIRLNKPATASAAGVDWVR